MDAELKARWVSALRSGEYRQTRSWLRRGDSFCCLGVLCDIYGQGEWRGNQFGLDLDHRQGGLPIDLCKDAEISNEEENTLAMMNDSGKSFAEIADYIEANL